MEYRELGATGLRVSATGLGGNTFGGSRLDREASIRCIRHARELGINFIDTAIIYGGGESEVFVGDAIRGSREQWVIATKFNLTQMKPGETPRHRIIGQCEESLRKLGTDYIDLYQMHFPAPGISMEEILEPLADLVHKGKVRWIGECNFASWRHAQANHIAGQHGWPTMVSCQNQLSLVRRHVELETIPFCEANKIGFLPYHPLAGGFLTDKYVRGKPPPPGTRGAAGSPIVRKSITERNEVVQDALKQWAQERGHSLGELAFSWLLKHPAVSSVIAGVSSPDQVELNARAGLWVLSDEEKCEVDRIAAWDGSGEAIELAMA